MKKITLLLILTCFVKPIFSQNSFYEKATLFTTSFDTIVGFVKRESERDLSLKIDFKKSLKDDAVKTYLPRELHSFKFESDGKVFETIDFYTGIASDRRVQKRFWKTDD